MYHISLEELKEVQSKAVEEGGPSDSNAVATWGCVIGMALFAVVERLESIANSLDASSRE